MSKVPVAGLLLASISTAWKNRAVYVKSLALPLAILAALTFMGSLVPEDSAELPGWYVPVLLAAGFASILFAIACHRIVLLGPPERPYTVAFGRQELKFIWMSVLLGFIFTGIMVVTMLLLVFVFAPLVVGIIDISSPESASGAEILLAGGLAILPAYYVLARCSMVLPAIAIGDDDLQIQDSWLMTKGNQWRVFIIVAVYPFGMSLIGEIFVLGGRNPFTNALSSIAYCIGLALGIFALSFVYRFLRRDYEPGVA